MSGYKMGQEIGKEVGDFVVKYVAGMLKPIREKLDNLPDFEAMCVDAVAKALAGMKKPRDGNDGRDGRDGRDAVEIDILTSISAERSYPKGTFAKHDGGLWAARKRTEGMDGWECIVEGIKAIGIEQIDERSFSVSIEKTSGEKQAAQFSMPNMAYKGIYKLGEKYRKGDTTTYSGSMWHCNEEGTREAPGDGKAWTLSVKRGRDGKDGARGEKGADGRAGKDLTNIGPNGEKW